MLGWVWRAAGMSVEGLGDSEIPPPLSVVVQFIMVKKRLGASNTSAAGRPHL